MAFQYNIFDNSMYFDLDNISTCDLDFADTLLINNDDLEEFSKDGSHIAITGIQLGYSLDIMLKRPTNIQPVHPWRVVTPFLNSEVLNDTSVNSTLSDSYSEVFQIEDAILPIISVHEQWLNSYKRKVAPSIDDEGRSQYIALVWAAIDINLDVNTGTLADKKLCNWRIHTQPIGFPDEIFTIHAITLGNFKRLYCRWPHYDETIPYEINSTESHRCIVGRFYRHICRLMRARTLSGTHYYILERHVMPSIFLSRTVKVSLKHTPLHNKTPRQFISYLKWRDIHGLLTSSERDELRRWHNVKSQ